MRGGKAGFVLLMAALPLALTFSPGVMMPTSASAQSACGSVPQPCTWNFSSLGSSGGGADVYSAQALGREGAGVLVAVVDSWVDASHPAFGGRVVDQVDCVGATDSSGNPDPGMCSDHTAGADACVHGTHVAGTIGSSNYGVAPRASILSVRVLTADSSGDCSGNTTDVAAGILYAADRGARVINLSVGDVLPGLGQDPNITAAVHQAAADGSLVVFAAGNSGLPFSDSYGSDALLVAATGPSGQLAGYSNGGGSVNLAAPGGDDGTSCAGLCFSGNGCTQSTCVLSTLPGNAYGLLEGTSMAAPHVSGTAALLFAENPSRSRDDVIHALEATAHPISGGGSGLIDAGAALALEPPAGGGGSAPAPPSTARAASVGSGAAVRLSSSSARQSGGSPLSSTTTGTGSTTSAPPGTSPKSPGSVPLNPEAVPRRSAAALSSLGKPDDAGSIAAAGAVAALLLLLSGAGTGVVALRRRR